MKTITYQDKEFTLVNSIKEVPKGCEIWACNAIEGYLLFAFFTKERSMILKSNKYALKCEGSKEIVKAVLCGSGQTLESYNKILSHKNKEYEKRVVLKALPFLQDLYNK